MQSLCSERPRACSKDDSTLEVHASGLHPGFQQQMDLKFCLVIPKSLYFEMPATLFCICFMSLGARDHWTDMPTELDLPFTFVADKRHSLCQIRYEDDQVPTCIVQQLGKDCNLPVQAPGRCVEAVGSCWHPCFSLLPGPPLTPLAWRSTLPAHAWIAAGSWSHVRTGPSG